MAVVAGEAIHFVFELLQPEVDLVLRFAFFWAELGAVGEDGFAAFFVEGRDVDDKRRSKVLREGSGVENFVRAIGFAERGEIFESGQEAGFVAQRRKRCSDRGGGLPNKG